MDIIAKWNPQGQFGSGCGCWEAQVSIPSGPWGAGETAKQAIDNCLRICPSHGYPSREENYRIVYGMGPTVSEYLDHVFGDASLMRGSDGQPYVVIAATDYGRVGYRHFVLGNWVRIRIEPMPGKHLDERLAPSGRWCLPTSEEWWYTWDDGRDVSTEKGSHEASEALITSLVTIGFYGYRAHTYIELSERTPGWIARALVEQPYDWLVPESRVAVANIR